MFENVIDKLDKCIDMYDVTALAISLYNKTTYGNEKQKNPDVTIIGEKINTILLNYQLELEKFGVIRAWSNFVLHLKKLEFHEVEHIGYKKLVDMIDKQVLNTTKTPFVGSKFEMNSLNMNAEDTGVFLFPKFTDNLRKKFKLGGVNLRKPIGNNTNDFSMDNISVFFKSEIGSYQIKFIYKDNRFSIESKNEYTIAICPFTCKNILEIKKISEAEDDFWFSGETVYGNSDEYQKRYLNQLDKLLQTDADFIVFPEMILTSAIINQLSFVIKKHKILKEKVIICGTNSINGENRCYVFDNYGQTIFVQDKATSFVNNDGLKELIKSNNIIHILATEQLGTIFLSICKDINNQYINKFVSGNDVDFLFVDAFSNSMDINTSAADLTKNQGCISVLCNSCGAFNLDKQEEGAFVNNHMGKLISYVNLPGITRSRRSHVQYELTIEENCLNCLKKCSPFIIKLSFDTYDMYADTKTCKIEKNRL